MMRPNLHLITERRAHRHAGQRDGANVRRYSGPTRGRRSEPSSRPVPAPMTAPAAVGSRDEAARRVRAAGGPVDRGFYTCSCGLMFQAAVSTTVSCPHCGDSQAW